MDRPTLPLIVIGTSGDPWLFNRDRDPLCAFEEPDIENNSYVFADAEGRAVAAGYTKDGSELEFSLVGGERTSEVATLEAHLLAFAKRIGWSEDAGRLVAMRVPYSIMVRGTGEVR